MMTRAYQEIYVSKAQSALGDAFDYAVNDCSIPGNDFVKLFTASSMSKRMENGEPACLAGKSGIEIVIEVIAGTSGKTAGAFQALQGILDWVGSRLLSMVFGERLW